MIKWFYYKKDAYFSTADMNSSIKKLTKLPQAQNRGAAARNQSPLTNIIKRV